MPRELRVALIDSGINLGHPHVGRVAGGVSFSMDRRGDISISADYADEIGHGTALAGILAYRAPFASIHAIKIFKRQLTTSTKVLLAAIKWALDQCYELVHLSLGTKQKEHLPELMHLCERASALGITVVASSPARQGLVYPAALPNVLGVYWNQSCDWDDLQYHPDEAIEFGAHGFPRQLPGLPQEMNFKGSSFAAAHVTSMAANFLFKDPNLSTNHIKQYLSESHTDK